MPNPRHEQLKLHIAGLLRGRRKLRIIDIGCGAGVMMASPAIDQPQCGKRSP